MNKKLAMKWVKALRSGKYKQGTHYLKDSEGNYCCLGVLCEIEKAPIRMYSGCYTGNGLKSYLGELGKSFKTPEGPCDNLASLNDSGLSFKQIARIIEKNYKKL